MTTAGQLSRARWPWSARFLFLALCSLGALTTLGTWWLLRTQEEERRFRALVEQKLAALRVAGQPVTAEDLARLYPDPPPAHDAQRILAESGVDLEEPPNTNWPFAFFASTNKDGSFRMDKRAIDALVAFERTNPPVEPASTNWPFVGYTSRKPTEPLDSQMVEAMRAFVETNRVILGSAPISRLIGARYPNGFPSALTSGPPNFKAVLNLARLFLVQSALRTEEGRIEEAVSALDTDLDLLHTLQGPHVAMVFSRRPRAVMACQVIERLLNRQPLTEAQLAALDSRLRAAEKPDLEDVLVLNRCLGVHEFAKMQSLLTQRWLERSMLPPPLRRLASQYPIKKLCSSEDLLRFLTETEEKLAALKPPVARKIHSLLESELESERTGKWRDRGYLFLMLGGGKMRFGPMPKDPTLGGFLLVTRTALAIERWRIDHNDRPPESLAELVPQYLPAVPQDPFDAQEMRYRPMRRGYFVYCVGMDGKDNAGRRLSTLYTEKEGYDAYSDGFRTRFRLKADSVPISAGHRSDGCRAVFRLQADGF